MPARAPGPRRALRVSAIALAFKANPRGHNFVHAREYASSNPWAARVREEPFEEIIRFL